MASSIPALPDEKRFVDQGYRANIARMNTDDLSLFVEVTRHGSFAAVAKARGLDPSAVSRAVAQLERELGARLLQRTTRTMRLTEAGERYLARIGPLLEELERAADEARGMRGRASGTLRLSASVTFGQTRIVPLLGAFRARHPDVGLDCVFTDTNLDLVADRIDLAIRLAPTVAGDMIVTKLADTRYRVVASPAYLAAAPRLQEPADLAAHRALLFPFPAYRTRWRFRGADGGVVEQPVAGDLVMAPATALIGAACDGLGPALLPSWAIDIEIAAGRLIDCFSAWDVTATTFDTAAWLIYPSRTFLPAKVRAMIEFLCESWA